MSIVFYKVSSIIYLIRNITYSLFTQIYIYYELNHRCEYIIYSIAFIMIDKHYDKSGIEEKKN